MKNSRQRHSRVSEKRDSLSPEESRLRLELQACRLEQERKNEELLAARFQLEQASHRYADFYDFAPAGYLSLDREGVILAANLTAATTLGLERSLLIGRPLQQLVTTGRQPISDMVRKVFQHQGREICDATVRQGERSCFVRIEAAASRNGHECRAVLIDMTEQRRVEEELHLLNEELERRVLERTVQLETALREQESFSYTVSHDLRAPLRHINGYLTIVKEEFGDKLPAEVGDYLDRVCGHSRHMGKLIDNLLNLAKVGRSELVRKQVNVSQLAAEVLLLLKENDPQRTVETAIEPKIVLNGDRTLLWLLLKNLLENAWKYTSKTEGARIELKSERRDGKTVVLVKDNGVGFDMAFRNQLFGVFQRLHGNEFGGLGIGLATVKRIVERHVGEVWAESQPGQGATFYFTVG